METTDVERDTSNTTISLQDYFERLLCEKEKRDEQRFKAQEVAANLALTSTKEALTVALTAVRETSSAATEANRMLAAKAEESANQKLEIHNNIRPWVQSLIEAQAKEIEAIGRRVSRFENREEGMTLTTKIIMGAVAFLATLLTIYFSLHK